MENLSLKWMHQIMFPSTVYSFEKILNFMIFQVLGLLKRRLKYVYDQIFILIEKVYNKQITI